ncbi:hypothetical protein GCM10011611_16200 [Aliidongia dinghuensis]|uniref:Uncharacterized protein n=1 Tax=Aliidongia dinghuensis TaxID=1867774 RepID=A0A8J3E1F0_9PROT|nr:hypothetical protein [Aliidongia dinghuensis]GGF11306.1 hypothetical protein GCM10011611_16200 [Aliidongia dinghuensis]
MWKRIGGHTIQAPKQVTFQKTVRTVDGSTRMETVTRPTNGVVHGRTPEDLVAYLAENAMSSVDFPLPPTGFQLVAQGNAVGRAAGDDKSLVAGPLNSCASVIYVDGTNFGTRAYVHHAPGGILRPSRTSAATEEKKSDGEDGDIEKALAHLKIPVHQAYVIYAHSNLNDFDFYSEYIKMLINAGVRENRIIQIRIDGGFCGFGITSDRVLCCYG